MTRQMDKGDLSLRIRARMANTPETSDHTSIKKRIESAKTETKQPRSLYAFIGNPREPMPDGLRFSFKDYLELVEWTGRVIREDKRGAIPNHLPGILPRLNIAPENWFTLTTEFEQKTQSFVGEEDQVRQAAAHLSKATGHIHRESTVCLNERAYQIFPWLPIPVDPSMHKICRSGAKLIIGLVKF